MSVYVKKESGFGSVHTSGKVKKGDIVYILSDLKVSKVPTRTSIKVNDGIHVEDEIGIYINHSCDPSCEIHDYKIVALRDLAPLEEITFDYSLNEDRLSSPFVCKECKDILSGFPAPCKKQ